MVSFRMINEILELFGLRKSSSQNLAEVNSSDVKAPIFNYSGLVEVGDFYSPISHEIDSAKSDLPEAICPNSVRSDLNDFFSRNKLGSYDWPLLKDNISAIKSSQTHLLGLIKYYEGDRNHYYEGYTASYRDMDGKGVLTGGFGSIKNTDITTNEGAYNQLKANLKEHTKYVINKAGGFDKFKEIPASLREALIDLSFNKGPDEINKTKLQKAISNKDWSSLISMLPKAKGTDVKTVAGLHRRSLSRAILALRDLKGAELTQAKKEVEKIYDTCKEYHEDNNISLEDVNAIWKIYHKDDSNIKLRSSESGKHLVKKGESYASIAKKYCPKGVNVNDFANEIKRYNGVPKGKDLLLVDRIINIPLEFNGEPSKVKPLVPREENSHTSESVSSETALTPARENNPTQQPKNTVSYSLKEKLSLYSISNYLGATNKEERIAIINKIIELNGFSKSGFDDNGYPVVNESVPKELLLPTEVKVNGKNLELKDLPVTVASKVNSSNGNNETVQDEKHFEKFLISEKYRSKGFYTVATDLFDSYKDTGIKSIGDFSDILRTINEDRKFEVGNEILIPTKEYMKEFTKSSNSSESGAKIPSGHRDDKSIDSSLSRLLDEGLPYKEVKKKTEPSMTIYEFSYKIKEKDSIYKIEKNTGSKLVNY